MGNLRRYLILAVLLVAITSMALVVGMAGHVGAKTEKSSATASKPTATTKQTVTPKQTAKPKSTVTPKQTATPAGATRNKYSKPTCTTPITVITQVGTTDAFNKDTATASDIETFTGTAQGNGSFIGIGGGFIPTSDQITPDQITPFNLVGSSAFGNNEAIAQAVVQTQDVSHVDHASTNNVLNFVQVG